jgi:hypothetical protein
VSPPPSSPPGEPGQDEPAVAELAALAAGLRPREYTTRLATTSPACLTLDYPGTPQPPAIFARDGWLAWYNPSPPYSPAPFTLRSAPPAEAAVKARGLMHMFILSQDPTAALAHLLNAVAQLTVMTSHQANPPHRPRSQARPPAARPPAFPRPADVVRDLATLLRSHDLHRLCWLACALIAITNGLTVWPDSHYLTWTRHGIQATLPAGDTYAAAEHLARLARQPRGGTS